MMYIGSKQKTFGNFQVNRNNNFVYSAAFAVSESPGEVFNPLFIYGGASLGKTHLLETIANEICIKNPEWKVVLENSVIYMDELERCRFEPTDAKLAKFRHKYRTADVLLLDDIHLINDYNGAQKELISILNVLINDGKAVIITANRHPKDIEHLDDRIRMCLLQGLLVDVNPYYVI